MPHHPCYMSLVTDQWGDNAMLTGNIHVQLKKSIIPNSIQTISTHAISLCGLFLYILLEFKAITVRNGINYKLHSNFH